MADEYRVEVEIATTDAQGQTGVVRREYRPVNADNPQAAAEELANGFTLPTESRLSPVDDGK